MKPFLDSGEYIHWQYPAVIAQAAAAVECFSDEEIAKRCFEFVRDSVKHNRDYRMNPMTCKTSDVLRHDITDRIGGLKKPNI